MTPQSEMKPEDEELYRICEREAQPLYEADAFGHTHTVNLEQFCRYLRFKGYTRSSGGQGLGANQVESFFKELPYRSDIHISDYKRLTEDLLKRCAIFGTPEARAVKWPEKYYCKLHAFNGRRKECRDCDVFYMSNLTVDACISAYNAGSGAVSND